MVNKNVFFDIARGSMASLALFMLIGIFAPFPVLYYSLKSGRTVGATIILVATLVLFTITPASALTYLGLCGLLSFMLAEFLAKGIGATKSIVLTTIIYVFGIILFVILCQLWRGVDFDSLVLKGINRSFIQAKTFFSNNNIDNDQLEALRILTDFTGMAYPSLVVVGIVAFAGVNLLLLKKFVHRLPRQLNIGDFSRFRNPDKFIWALIASGFALLLNNDLVTRIALNVLVVVISLYFVQGLAVTAHFFKKYQVPRFIVYLFYALLVVQLYLAVLVAAVGLFDLWCDFRTPKKQENL